MSKKYAVQLLRLAEEDLTDLVDYIALDNPDAALGMAKKIEKKLSSLSGNPNLGTRPKEEEFKRFNYRFLVIDNYLVFYTIENEIIYVHRILHGARDYLRILK